MDFKECAEITDGFTVRKQYVWDLGENVQCGYLSCLGVSISRAMFGISCFFSLWWHSTRKIIIITQSLVDKGCGSEDFQHCIDITQGPEERIPTT